MYGLLKSCTCSSSKTERELKRLAYCGTCKVLGSLYGQKTRMLLNHDASFLAELLFAIRDTAKLRGEAFRSFNCMQMPDKDQIPIELQISSSINLLLAEFKLLDRLEDSPGIVSQFAYRAFSDSFASAADSLTKLDFPVQEAFLWLKTQSQRELAAKQNLASAKSDFEPEQQLLHFAEATFEVTALFFKHAAIACALEQRADIFYALGRQFGILIYVLDALEDYQSDCDKKNFNGIRASYSLQSELTAEIREEVCASIKGNVEEICQSLELLELPKASLQQFQQRFKANIKKRLAPFEEAKESWHYHAKPAKKAECLATNTRFESAKQFCLKISSAYKQPTNSKPVMAVLAAQYSFLFALVFPETIKDTESFKDCLEMPFNLIFISSIPKRIVSLFNAIFWQLIPAFAGTGNYGLDLVGLPQGQRVFANIGTGKKKRRNNGESGENNETNGEDPSDCCDCDGCDCCCDCDGCDCCGDTSCDGCCSSCHGCHCSSCDCAGCDCAGCDCAGCDASGCDCSCN